MIRLAVFDLDGTILDTRDDLGSACNHALVECGFPERRMWEYNLLVGRGIDNLFRGAMPKEAVCDENVARMRSIFVPYYNEHIADLTRPYPGCVEMLEALRSKGIRLAVASNKYQQGTEILVEKFFPGMFDAVLGKREGSPLKPDPQIVFDAIALSEQKSGMHIERAELAYIGDSNVDMITGRNAGARTIGVSWGFRSTEELLLERPFTVVDTMKQLLNAILH